MAWDINLLSPHLFWDVDQSKVDVNKHLPLIIGRVMQYGQINDWKTIQKYVGIQWLQFVPFVEIGRVAPSWNLDLLHSDMQWDAGLGIRAWAKGIVIRIDTAYSDEGLGLQMMVSQPFQF